MVNVIIYLNKDHDAKNLVKYLLTERLIASATIDEKNISYKLVENLLVESTHTVVTTQSKSMLFIDIVKAVRKKIGEEVPINSIPIVGVNRVFDEIIRMNTLPI